MKKFWIALACIALFLVALDQIGVLVADVALEGALRDRLELQKKPKVRVHGIPFLTQVIDGKYRDIEVDATGLDAGKLHDLSADVRLRGVHVSISQLGRWDFSTIPIDHVKADITVPYNSLEAASGIPGVTIKPDGSDVDVSGPVAVAGRTITVTAKGHPTISNGALLLNPSDATAAGIPLPPGTLDSFNAPISLASLPFGLKLNAIDVTQNGLLGEASVDDVTIQNGQLVKR